MLLLILAAGCLSSCAAQTTSFPFFTSSLPTTDNTPLTESVQSSTTTTTTTTQSTDASAGSNLAILRASVHTEDELTEADVTVFLEQLRQLIMRLDPDLKITLTLRGITKV